MKRFLLSVTLTCMLFPFLIAQTPQGINYQAVVRGASGNLQINKTLSVRFSIEDGLSTVYQELHNTTSNGFGLVELVIGRGTAIQGTFATVPWSQGPYFLKVEIDVGSGFVSLGTTELVSVPYALYAENAGQIDNLVLTDLDDVANQAPMVDQVLKWDGTSWVPKDDEDNADNDSDPANEIQSLSLSGTDLSLSNGGGSVSLPTTSYTAGAGIEVSSNVIINTGDTDPTDDIMVGSAAGGDLAGTYPDPTVAAVQGRPFSSTAPSSGQVLKWNGSEWEPADDQAGSAVWNTSGTNTYYNNGDVGIGTSSIDAKTEVFHNSSLTDPHVLLHENGNDYARLNMRNNNGTNYWSIAAYIASNNQNDRLNFWNGTTGDVMTITGDGEVGIGVGISPKVPFHIGNNRRVLFGQDTLGSGDKLMFLPDLHAFRVGTVSAGAASTYWNRDSIGLYSFASGLNTRAQGYAATAMGRDTEATNSYAFASGFFTNADGLYSTAMGFNTDALALGSTALGYSTDAEENYATAMGYFAEAQAIYATAIGNNVRAQSFSSTALGRYNVGGGSASNWISTDPIFEIGVGTGPSSRRNAVTVRKNGNVGIGTTTPLAELHVDGQIRLASVEYIEDGGTNEIAFRGDLRPVTDNLFDLGTINFRWDDVYATNGTVQTSDLRQKENIEDIPYGIEELMKLRPVRFTWKDQPHQEPKLGLIAQDLLPVIKEVVKTHNYSPSEEDETVLVKEEMDRLGVYYSDLIPVLIRAMQEQQDQIERLEERIKKLEQ